MMTPSAQTTETISFGPFRLVASERLLTKDGVPVELSPRAFDILVTLLSRPTEVVTKGDLMDRAWPGVTVEEGSLRFHITNLRKALGDGSGGARYITTVSGRGYCFVAPVSRSGEQSPPPKTPGRVFREANLPGRLGAMIDREEDLKVLLVRLHTERFVTVVGSGGVGKTTLAVAVGHQLIDHFAGAVLFVDLSMIGDPDLVPTVVASMLGLSVQSADATPGLVAHLRDKRMLLILDTCEHLIETVATLAAAIYATASQVHVLATSRETLQVEGEHVYRLEPLECAPDDEVLTAAAAMTFPATQLFLDRARASGARLEFSDAEAAVVVSMCRKLDGVALAIELAARRVEAYGVHQTAAMLDQRLTLLWVGSRSAPPRHKTLQATLDWSYKLLSDVERIVLCRLAIFAGHFPLDAALAIATSASVDRSLVFSAIDSLVAKSMVATRPVGAMMRYRLLDTTRAYARESSADDAEFADVAARHAIYYRQWLEQRGIDWPTLTTAAERAPHFGALNNVRAALEWAFGSDGNAEIGIGLAAAAVPVFLTMSLLPECHRWSERAMVALADGARGGAEEMHLQAGLGISSMHIHGESEAARAALSRSLAVAEARGDLLHQVGMLGLLHMFHFRGGEFKTAVQYARRCRSVAGIVEDPAAMALAHSILGRSLHLSGELDDARVELLASLELWSHSPSATIYISFDRHYRAGIALARTLWLLGFPAQAVERIHQAIEDAEAVDHPASLAVASLAWAASIFLWTGDVAGVNACIDSSVSHAASQSLGPLSAVCRARKAELAIYQGDAHEGVESLRASLGKIHAAHYELMTTEFNISLVQGLRAAGRLAEGIALIDETIELVETNGDLCYMPELLRAKGSLLLAMPRAGRGDAEACLIQSLALSRKQGTRAWELRAATDLANLYAGQGQSERGLALLLPVFEQFTEGFETADLIAAKSLLSALGGDQAPAS
jgi:predicted ATPase/DNA-binding winged helix-turn-helix (wHTH) protein